MIDRISDPLDLTLIAENKRIEVFKNIVSLRVLRDDDFLALGISSSRNNSKMYIAELLDGTEVLCFLKVIPLPKLSKEYDANRRVHEVEGLNTFEVIYIAHDGEKGCFVTMGIRDLLPVSKISIRSVSIYHELIDRVLSLIRDLHKAGVSHGDLQTKNLGIKTETGEIYIFDFEFSEVNNYPLTGEVHMQELELFLEQLKYQAYEDGCQDSSGNNASLDYLDEINRSILNQESLNY